MIKAERPCPADGSLKALRECRYLLMLAPVFGKGLTPYTNRQHDDAGMAMSGALQSEIYA